MNAGFDCRLKVAEIRDGDRIELSADPEACAAIARRLGLDAIDRLDAHTALSRDGTVVTATGRIKASLAQQCSVTGEPLATHVDAPFDLVFRADPPDAGPDSEIELDSSDCDTVFYDGLAIPLGEAIADTLALEIDPYPRGAGADAALREAGVMSEEEVGPFAALAALKGKFEKPDG